MGGEINDQFNMHAHEYHNTYLALQEYEHIAWYIDTSLQGCVLCKILDANKYLELLCYQN